MGKAGLFVSEHATWEGIRTEFGNKIDSFYCSLTLILSKVNLEFETDTLTLGSFTTEDQRSALLLPMSRMFERERLANGLSDSQAEYFYEFLSLRSLDKGIMADPTVNVPLLGTVPHKASVVQVGFPCLGKQDGVAAFEVNVIVMNSEGNTILQTPQNAIFFKTCQQAECPGGCRNGGFCNERRVCECPDGFYGPHCEKALCIPRCLNGGLCVTPGFCICPPGFYGVNCDKGKCPQPCRNGGKCIGKSKCKCPKGYQGDLCSKRYGASLMHAPRPAGARQEQHTPPLKKAEEPRDPPESNYIW
ncbi:Wnt inhibitory factor 1 [Microtus ochrogaster]|uniref:Wnt inhibitory factor 1 n=1 Tax=Microtus ochrogaster TaxID=79684 RepID=A0A8J6KLM9_MICOH|nr:Wnt inhibitory factor 1 [Microtus ochrogaster]